MKQLKALLVWVLSCYACHAQQPVHWKFEARRKAGNTSELHLMATLDKGWHIYAGKQPAGALATPTVVRIAANPLVQKASPLSAVGCLIKESDPVLGITQHYYADSVDFVQVVQWKAKAGTSVNGTIRYQACSDEKCLPPVTIAFKIVI